MPVKIGSRLYFGPQMADFHERINIERMRREKLAKTRAGMKEAGIAAMLVATSNMRYAIGVRSPEGSIGGSYALVFTEGDPIVFLQYEHVVHCRSYCTWINPDNIRRIPPLQGGIPREAVKEVVADRVKQLIAALKERKVLKEKISMEDGLPGIKAGLEKAGVKFGDSASDLMLDVRAVKTDDEVLCMKMSGTMAEKAWYAMFNSVKPGMTDNELSAIGTAEMIKMGAEGPFKVSVRSGPLTAPNYTGMRTDRMIQWGDLQMCDIWGKSFLGYMTCYYRTWKIGGKPTQKEKDWFKRVYDWLVDVADAIKPGVSTADVAKVTPPASTWGLKDEYETNVNWLGHGFGCGDWYDRPHIHRAVSLKYPEEIKKNMCISIEPWYGERFQGGVRLEDTGVVTDKGFESFYTVPNDRLLIPKSCNIFED